MMQDSPFLAMLYGQLLENRKVLPLIIPAIAWQGTIRSVAVTEVDPQLHLVRQKINHVIGVRVVELVDPSGFIGRF